MGAPLKRSKAQEALKADLRTTKELARAIGDAGYATTPRAVESWRQGSRVPQEEAAKRAIEKACGIAPIDWDTLGSAGAPRTPRDPSEPRERATPEAVQELADELMAEARRQLDEIRDTEGADEGGVRARKTSSLAATVVDLGRLTGATMVNERQIVRSGAWRRLLSLIDEALAPFGPEPGRAVIEALKEIEG